MSAFDAQLAVLRAAILDALKGIEARQDSAEEQVVRLTGEVQDYIFGEVGKYVQELGTQFAGALHKQREETERLLAEHAKATEDRIDGLAKMYSGEFAASNAAHEARYAELETQRAEERAADQARFQEVVDFNRALDEDLNQKKAELEEHKAARAKAEEALVEFPRMLDSLARGSAEALTEAIGGLKLGLDEDAVNSIVSSHGKGLVTALTETMDEFGKQTDGRFTSLTELLNERCVELSAKIPGPFDDQPLRDLVDGVRMGLKQHRIDTEKLLGEHTDTTKQFVDGVIEGVAREHARTLVDLQHNLPAPYDDSDIRGAIKAVAEKLDGQTRHVDETLATLQNNYAKEVEVLLQRIAEVRSAVPDAYNDAEIREELKSLTALFHAKAEQFIKNVGETSEYLYGKFSKEVASIQIPEIPEIPAPYDDSQLVEQLRGVTETVNKFTLEMTERNEALSADFARQISELPQPVAYDDSGMRQAHTGLSERVSTQMKRLEEVRDELNKKIDEIDLPAPYDDMPLRKQLDESFAQFKEEHSVEASVLKSTLTDAVDVYIAQHHAEAAERFAHLSVSVNKRFDELPQPAEPFDPKPLMDSIEGQNDTIKEFKKLVDEVGEIAARVAGETTSKMAEGVLNTLNGIEMKLKLWKKDHTEAAQTMDALRNTIKELAERKMDSEEAQKLAAEFAKQIGELPFDDMQRKLEKLFTEYGEVSNKVAQIRSGLSKDDVEKLLEDKNVLTGEDAAETMLRFGRMADDLLEKVRNPDFRLVIDDEGKPTLRLMGDGEQVKSQVIIPMPAMPEYKGVYNVHVKHSAGHLVTYGGSLWWALKDNPTSRPGIDNTEWKLIVKAGKDGKDGKHGQDGHSVTYHPEPVMGTTYRKGDFLRVHSRLWLCQQDTVKVPEGAQLQSSPVWALLGNIL